MQTTTATTIVGPPSPAPRDRHEDDRLTARILGGRGIIEEIPAEALAAYERWKIALAEGEPDAVAAHDRLMVDLDDDLSIDALAERIDGPDERRVIEVIFGRREAPLVHDVLRDDFMRRSDEAPYALDRVRGRLEAGCPTESDVAAIRADAARRVTDEDLLALAPFAGDEAEAREIRRRVVRGQQDHVCTSTGLRIPAGERHLALTETLDGEIVTTRHSLAAAWCDVVLEDPSLADELRPPPEQMVLGL